MKRWPFDKQQVVNDFPSGGAARELRLRALEEENRELRKLLAQSMREKADVQEIFLRTF